MRTKTPKTSTRGDLGGSVDRGHGFMGCMGLNSYVRELNFPHFSSQAEGAIQSLPPPSPLNQIERNINITLEIKIK